MPPGNFPPAGGHACDVYINSRDNRPSALTQINTLVIQTHLEIPGSISSRLFPCRVAGNFHASSICLAASRKHAYSPPVGRTRPTIVYFLCQTNISLYFHERQLIHVEISGKHSVTARSIFQKVCPSCMATLATDATGCTCGFVFEQEDNQPSSVEIRIKAEELYENYLAARAEQAAEAVKTAQAEFTRDLNNPTRSKNITRFVNESRTAEASLTAQRAHIAELRKLVEVIPATKAPAPMVPPMPVVAKPAATKPVQAVRSASALATPDPKPERSRPEKTARTRVVVRASKTNIHVSAPATQATMPVPAVAAARPSVPVAPISSAVPDRAFRDTQAAKAAKVMRATQTESQTKPLPPAEPVMEAAPAPVPIAAPFKPAPARKPMLLRSTTDKECPNCTATVSANSERCRCGYEFAPGGSLIPGLTMTEEERAAFARIFA